MNDLLKEQVSLLPRQPGVYIFKAEDNRILYVGKARILINRVRSYFTPKSDRRLRALVANIDAVEYVATDNEVEALILENNLIKQFDPKYNIKLKDAKSYPYIKLTREPFPRVFRCREKRNSRDEYFGPYVSMRTVTQIMKIFKKILKLVTCTRSIRPDKPSSPCLLYHIGMCSGACAGLISRDEYSKQVEAAREILKGKTRSIKLMLKEKMEYYSERMEYEEAVKIRDQLMVLDEYITQSIEVDERGSADFVGIYTQHPWSAISLVRRREGKVIGKENFLIKRVMPDSREIEEFCQAYYLNSHEIPATVFLEADSIDFSLLKQAVKNRSGFDLRIECPWYRRDKSILKLAYDNAELHFEEKRVKLTRIHQLRAVKKALGLAKLPRRIEGFDVATLDGKFNTAALVCFVDGKPDKTEYRQFNIPNQEHPDDYAMMETVLVRRYSRRIKEKQTLPDLVLVDGGKGQVSVAQKVLSDLDLDIPIIGLAKKEEKLLFPGKSRPLVLAHTSSALQLLVAVRNEAHRFSNIRLKKRVSGKYLQSVLNSIPGIGSERIKTLIRQFKSVKSIRKATVSDLSTVAGIGAALAETIYHYLHEQKQ